VLSPAALEQERLRALDAAGRALVLPAWPAVPVSWNRRLRRAGRAVIDHRQGRFRAAAIELSPAYFEVYPEDLPGILVHEAVHVGLAVQGRPFGHGPQFRRACTAAGGLLHSRWLPGRVFRYLCPLCQTVLERRRRAAESLWCADCVALATRAGREPYRPEHVLRLVATTFRGLEAAGLAAQPVCDGAGEAGAARHWAESGSGSRYPVAEPETGSSLGGGP
jgi:predicted SprT family Zn-dependent metalloprotease